MKNILFISILFLGTHCSQLPVFEKTNEKNFVKVDDKTVEKFNATHEKFNLYGLSEIVSSYYPEDKYAEGNYSYKISEPISKGELTQVILEVSGINADSVEGIRMVFMLKKGEQGYTILSIHEQYKCWEERGSQEWSKEYCM